MSLPDCISKLVGTWVTPPRNEVFGSNAQRFLVKKMDNHGLFVEIVFESRNTALRVLQNRGVEGANSIRQFISQWALYADDVKPVAAVQGYQLHYLNT